MRIKVTGSYVVGYVDYDNRGSETDVIAIYVDKRGPLVTTAKTLPVHYAQAKLILACFNETFLKAEEMLEHEMSARAEEGYAKTC